MRSCAISSFTPSISGMSFTTSLSQASSRASSFAFWLCNSLSSSIYTSIFVLMISPILRRFDVSASGLRCLCVWLMSDTEASAASCILLLPVILAGSLTCDIFDSRLDYFDSLFDGAYLLAYRVFSVMFLVLLSITSSTMSTSRTCSELDP